MQKIWLSLSGALLVGFSAIGQQALPVELGLLPGDLDGASGLEYIGPNSLWSHSDNNSGPEIFEIDETGVIQRTITIGNATARDFEDMTQDNVGNLYIGDFGNEFNDRTDLKIYKIPPPSQIMGNTVQAEEIEFLLPDQTQFPPPKGEENFDIESMIHFNGSLYLFTRDRGLDLRTKVYRLPDTPGQHAATLMGSFKTTIQIAGADISPDGETLVLISNTGFWVFYDFVGNDFFGGSHTSINWPFTQKEGVVFSDNETLFIVDNREVNPTHGKLYRLSIPNLVSSVAAQPSVAATALDVFPNPSNGAVQFQSPTMTGDWTLSIFGLTGNLVSTQTGSGPIQSDWNSDNAAKGVYFYQLNAEGILPQTGKFVVQ
mgnify:CR=1 FL=1